MKEQSHILGTGCKKCELLAGNAENAATELGIDFEIQKVTDINEIMKFGVMLTPALAIDDDVKSVGNVLSSEEIMELLK